MTVGRILAVLALIIAAIVWAPASDHQAALDCSGVSADMRKRIRAAWYTPSTWRSSTRPSTAIRPRRSPRFRCRGRRSRFPPRISTPSVQPFASARTRRSATDRRSSTCPDIVEMLVATGMRIDELLTLRWSDIELTPPPARRDDEDWFPCLMVNGQITSKGKRVDYGKTDAAIRPIALPDWAAALLRRRKVAQASNDLDAVFVTRNGTWHYPTNIQGRLRHIRQRNDYAGLTALQGVTPHSFRRTVATKIDQVNDAEAARNRLGHTSKTVTERHYINRKFVVPDHRAATESLAPGSGASHGAGPAEQARFTRCGAAAHEEAALSALRDHDWPPATHRCAPRPPTGAISRIGGGRQRRRESRRHRSRPGFAAFDGRFVDTTL